MHLTSQSTTLNETLLTLKQAKQITGGLSAPSKIPGYAYNLPPSACITGCLLSKVKNSVCSICYGKKYRYLWASTLKALYRRLESLSHPLWAAAMAILINHYQTTNRKPHTDNPDCNYFRLFPSFLYYQLYIMYIYSIFIITIL